MTDTLSLWGSEDEIKVYLAQNHGGVHREPLGLHEAGVDWRHLESLIKSIYTVTIQVVSNLSLTPKQKFCFTMRSIYKTQHLFLCHQED